MYSFHYDYIKPKYGPRANPKLLMTQTRFVTKLKRTTFTKTYPQTWMLALTQAITLLTILVTSQQEETKE